MTYTRRTRYTPEELDALALADLRNDAEFSERQAENGPYFPEHGITRESLIAYAQKLRAQITKVTNLVRSSERCDGDRYVS